MTDAAERVAIGMRRFVLTAVEDPTGARRCCGCGPARRCWSIGRRRRSSPTCARQAAAPARFRSEAAAIDLVQGTVLAAMRTVLERRAGAEHASDVAATVLRGLGVDAAEADAIASRPLPG